MFFVREIYKSPEDFGRVFDGLLIVPHSNGIFECGREFLYEKDSHLIKTMIIENVLSSRCTESVWILNCCGTKAECIDLKDKQIQSLYGGEPFEISKFGNDGSE